jgi:gamma-glutamyltranspeptidase/glutathione hydrolase
MISSADALATKAGVRILEQNGNAIDAAIATSAAMAVVAPHLCGMGGDLFALVHVDGQVHSLNAAGRAGSGVNPEQLRQQGFTHVPMSANFNSVTVPGCVAGWLALHERFGTLPLELLFADAIGLAENGFRSSPLLINSFKRLDDSLKRNFKDLYSATTEVAPTIKRPGVGRTLRAVATHGRDAFYAGEFAEGLIEMASGMYTREDLAGANATWDQPISIDVHGHRIWSTAAPSQGYLFLAALAISEQLDLPDDPNDAQWAHLLIEASTAVGYDRTEILHDRADLGATLNELVKRKSLISPQSASPRHHVGRDGDTTYMCAVDRNSMGVSLINSNASGFGSGLVEQRTGINLHNRGLGFSLMRGHASELAAGRQPPHTLCPALITRKDGPLFSVLGTMGGDAQPQIILQLITRLLRSSGAARTPAEIVNAGRWVLRGPTTGFDTWSSQSPPTVQVEGHAPESWLRELAARGHQVEQRPRLDSGFGHANMIVIDANGNTSGGADSRTVVGSCE